MALTIMAALAVVTGRAQSQPVPTLLGPAAAGARVPAVLAQRVDTLQSRPVSVNGAALASDAFDVELENGRIVRAVVDRRESHGNGVEAWAGHIPGEPFSSVTLAWRSGVVQGSVRLLDGSYSIEPSGAPGVHVLRKVDPDAMPPEAEPLVPNSPALLAAAGDPPTSADDGSTFDVIAFYTPAAEAAALAAGTAVDTRIALGVSETNTAYANSGVIPRLRLVGTQLTNYTESGDHSLDLSRFRTAGDGFMDEVHAARNAAGADLVVLITGSSSSACGVGYVMTSASSSFADWAFSVTVYGCISPNYTFAHELGHNMGSAHAPEDGSGQSSLYPYSFGYKNPSNLFRTVMAYNCTSGCPRVLHFSNPNVNYSGAPTGTVSPHNNALSLNNARTTIANWRQSTAGGNTPPTISSIADVDINEDAATPSIAFTIADAETAAGSLSVTAVSANSSLVPNTASALSLGGSGGGRTLVVVPAANAFGSAVITVTVSDGTLTASRTFTLAVFPVNDAPTISRSPGAATIATGSSAQTTVTVNDVDSSGASLALTSSSSNPTLLPMSGVATTVVSTTATSRTFLVTMTPAGAQVGSATVTFTASDGGLPAATTFSLSVVPSLPTPGAPGDILASFSGRTVSMSWTPPSTGDPVTFYNLEVGSAPGLADLAIFPLSSTPGFTAGGVPNGVFWVRVRPYNGAGAGPSTADLGLVMSAAGGCVGLPLAPFFNTPSVVGANVGLSWTVPAGSGPAASSYVISAGSAPGLSNIIVFDTGSPAPGLGTAAPPGVYHVRVAARNACGIGAPSNEVIVTVP